MKKTILGLLLTIGLLNIALADTVILKNGHSVPCKSCAFVGTQAIITHDCGTIKIPRAMVAAVKS